MEGVVPGGGLILYRAITELEKIQLPKDQQIGLEIVKKALEEPIRQIAANSGREGADQ